MKLATNSWRSNYLCLLEELQWGLLPTTDYCAPFKWRPGTCWQCVSRKIRGVKLRTLKPLILKWSLYFA